VRAPEYFSEEGGIFACRFSLKDRGTYPIGITLNKQHALRTLQIKVISGHPDAKQTFASISNIASIVRPSSQYMMSVVCLAFTVSYIITQDAGTSLPGMLLETTA
jgi:hypothetical protein